MVLTVKELKIAFGGKEPFVAVKDISFELDRGKTLAIVGESGSGKSLTALALMGLLPKGANMEGKLLLDVSSNQAEGEERLVSLTGEEIYKIRGKGIGMVFQEPMSALNPVMSVGKQLKEAILAHQPITNTEGKTLAIEWLHKVQLPEPDKIYDRYPHQLSGGQKQRVMIAMAMCNHPALLIADEPTTALDVTVQQEIIKLMSFLQQEHGSAMIFITHDLALAATIADEVMVLYKGELIEYGATADVLQHPKHPYTQALLASRPGEGQKGYRLPIVDDFIAADKGRAVATVIEHKLIALKPDTIGEPMLQTDDVRIWFADGKRLPGRSAGYFKAVDGVSFTINKGEVLGLVGESGCGKSTLSRSLVGLAPVHSGKISYKGKDLARLPLNEWKHVRRDIQMIFQDPYSSLNPRMTIGDAIMEPLLVHNMVPKQEVQKEARRLMGLVQLPVDALQRYPHQFSGGQRQRIGIARALALKPKLLICDESVSALDVSIQAQILNLLKELQAEFDLTYLFISHDLAVVHYISDRVMVMKAGKIIESGTAEQVLKHPDDAYTKLLIAAMPKNIINSIP